MPFSLTVTILCFNEERGLRDTYTAYKKILTDLGTNHEFIIVNDGSTDRTAQIAEEIKGNDPTVNILTNKNSQGMGQAFKQGLKKASKEFFMFTGGYNALSEENVTRLISTAKEQDITLAYMTNPEIRKKFRRKVSTLFTSIMNILTSLDLCYYNGMHIARTSCLRSISIRSNHHTFSAECVVKLIKYRNCSFREVPVTVNFGQKTNKKLKSKVTTLAINIFDAFRFFYFLCYDGVINKRQILKKDR